MYTTIASFPGSSPGLPPRLIQQLLNPVVVFALLLSLVAPALPYWLPMSLPAALPMNPAQQTTVAPLFTGAKRTTAQFNAMTTAAPATTWRGYPEIVERRDAFANHYDLGDGRVMAVVRGQNNLVQAPDGEWRAYDQRIRAVEGGFAYQQHGLSVSMGRTTSTALLQRGETLVGWQPQSLVVRSDGGSASTTLATVINEGAIGERATVNAGELGTAQLNADGSTVTYANHWSDQSLRETFHSTQRGIEQSLIFAQAPALPQPEGIGEELAALRRYLPTALGGNRPTALALESDLFLLSGDSIWVDGELRTHSFSTAESATGEFSIRNAAGETRMTFAPVVAFEQNDSSQRVQGHYEAELLEKNIWRLRVVTPWSWWQAAERNYPVVLDPEVYVAVIKPATITLYDLCELLPDAGPFDYCPVSVPNDPVGAITASYGTYFYENDEGFPVPYSTLKVESKVIFDIFPTLPTEAYVIDAELVLTGNAVGSKMQLEVIDTVSEGFLGEFTTDTVEWTSTMKETAELVRTVDLDDAAITTLVNQWNNNGPNEGLTIRPKNVSPAELCNATTFHEKDLFELGCGFFGTSAPELLIEYEDPNLVATIRLDGQPMPSVHSSLDHTYHEHELVNMASIWHGVALVDNANGDQTSLEINDVSSQFDGDKTNYLVFDNENNGGPINTMQIEVHPRTDGTDNGTYSLYVAKASNEILPPQVFWQAHFVDLHPGAPLHLYSFDFPGEHTMAVRVKLPAALNTVPKFYGPRPGANDAIGNAEWTAPRGIELLTEKPPADDAGIVTYSMQSTKFLPGTERWVIAIPFDEIAEECPVGHFPPGVAQAAAGACDPIPVEIQTLACPLGEYPTPRWGCQPVIYPHDQLGGGVILPPREADANATEEAGAMTANVPRTRFYDVGNVRIFSEGGFIGEVPADGSPDADMYGLDKLDRSYKVCTEEERLGMPLLGTTADSIPALGVKPPSHLIAVQQGSVCVTEDDEIDIIGGGPIPGYSLLEDEFGAVVVPSVSENAPRNVRIYEQIYGEEVHLYQGRLDIGDDKDNGSAFGTTEHGKMRQNEVNEYRFDLIEGTTNVAANPWGGWTGINPGERYIDVDQSAAVGTDSGTVQVAPGKGEPEVGMSVMSDWKRWAELVNYGMELNADIQLPTTSVATLETRFHAGGTASLNSEAFQVDEVHMTDATVHQSAEMGGAYRHVQAVVGRPNLDNICSNDVACLDLRNEYDIDNPEWKMPDIDVGGPTGTVIVNAAGNLQVFSADHPAQGVNAAAANFEQSFNFKAFDATVSIKQKECPVELANNPIVTVIQGSATIGLPSLNDGAGNAGENVGGMDNETPSLKVSFTLCQNQFREAMLFFDASPPGIVAGASGMVIESLSGKVTAGEGYVQIALGLGFRAVDGTTITNGGGTIIIDTRGMFRLEGGVLQEACEDDEPCIGDDGKPMADLVTVFSVDGTLQVAWNPLDILVEVSISYEDWITGFLRMHMWRGQGWQNAYHWLPDNDDFHFTGMIGATFLLKEGRIGEFFGVELPRQDIEISVEIAFGEFCSNEACNQYEWGVQGKVKVMEFTIGVFIGKSSGVDFFIGDKDKKLIDQAFVSAAAFQAADAIPASLVSDLAGAKVLDIPKDATACVPSSSSSGDLCTFTIEAGTAEAMIAVAWSEGTLPTVLLHAPDGTVISAHGLAPDATESAQAGSPIYRVDAGGTVRMAYSGEDAFYTIMNPVAGDWLMTLENLTGNEHYNIVYAANTPAPVLTLTAPNNINAGASLNITWNVEPMDSTADVTLGYVAAADYEAAITAGEPIAATPIGAAVPANQGNFLWNIGALPTGRYYIQARIDHPIHGVAYSYSPGAFRYEDLTPPAVPNGLFLSNPLGSDNGLVAHWQRNIDADLYAYEVLYSSPDLDAPGGLRERIQRIVPSDRFTANPTHEQVRLVGLLPDVESTVCVRAIDSSGNVSACSGSVNGTPAPQGAVLWYEPELTMLMPEANRSVNVLWGKNGLGSPDGYTLSWARGCAAGYAGPPANEGQSNLNVGNVTQFRLTGLPAGNYRVAVRGYTAVGGDRRAVPVRFSNYSNSMTTVLTNGVDGDGDGLPDDWATYFGVTGAGVDSDGDTLSNQQELNLGLNPTRRDSDDDGFYDNDELNLLGTNPCDPADGPDGVEALTMVVKTANREESLRFKKPVNEGQSPVRRLRVSARGVGLLDYEVTADQPWIQLSKTSGGPLHWANRFETVEVRVNTVGMTPGFYTGTVVVLGSSDEHPVLEALQRIPVRLWVLRDKTYLDTRISGTVFLDENGNGRQEGSETTLLSGIAVDVVGEVGAVLGSFETNGSGAFTIDAPPYANYALQVNHPDYVVTTENPLPIALRPGEEYADGLVIGLAPNNFGGANDDDGDTVPNQDEDVNGDGNPANDDTDGDGIADYLDADDDGDTIPTKEERTRGDSDGDGIPNFRDADDDGDRILTIEELTYGDTDNDGIPNFLDIDDDGDGVNTVLEGRADSNLNGIPDYLDAGSSPPIHQVLLPLVYR